MVNLNGSLELVQRNIDQGFYAQELLEKYSETEWDELNSIPNTKEMKA